MNASILRPLRERYSFAHLNERAPRFRHKFLSLGLPLLAVEIHEYGRELVAPQQRSLLGRTIYVFFSVCKRPFFFFARKPCSNLQMQYEKYFQQHFWAADIGAQCVKVFTISREKWLEPAELFVKCLPISGLPRGNKGKILCLESFSVRNGIYHCRYYNTHYIHSLYKPIRLRQWHTHKQFSNYTVRSIILPRNTKSVIILFRGKPKNHKKKKTRHEPFVRRIHEINSPSSRDRIYWHLLYYILLHIYYICILYVYTYTERETIVYKIIILCVLQKFRSKTKAEQ